jgi:hypothetical protein
MLSKKQIGVNVKLYTKTISKTLELDIDKHRTYFPQISVNVFFLSHDRFILIDQKELYHFGASLKYLGKKWFAFSRMDSFINKF